MNRIKINHFFVLLLCIWGSLPTLRGQAVQSYPYARRDTGTLWMDVYQPQEQVRKEICMVYVFGGGFIMGSRTEERNVRFFRQMAARGYTVAAIDYRLGLKGVRLGLFNLAPGFQAPVLAAEDLIGATRFLLDNREELRIDPRRIVLVGSSAGAITVLHADRELANRTAMAAVLPPGFRYAAVVSLAGAILSTQGRPRYSAPPAPTLFFHGTKDKIVAYNKKRFFRKGMFGTNALVNIFRKHDFSYMAVRYEGIRHKAASFPRFEEQDLICDFVDKAVAGGFDNQVDMTVRDRELVEKYGE